MSIIKPNFSSKDWNLSCNVEPKGVCILRNYKELKNFITVIGVRGSKTLTISFRDTVMEFPNTANVIPLIKTAIRKIGYVKELPEDKLFEIFIGAIITGEVPEETKKESRIRKVLNGVQEV